MKLRFRYIRCEWMRHRLVDANPNEFTPLHATPTPTPKYFEWVSELVKYGFPGWADP